MYSLCLGDIPFRNHWWWSRKKVGGVKTGEKLVYLVKTGEKRVGRGKIREKTG